MLKVQLTNDVKVLDKQIKALESLVATDNPKDRGIHVQAIKELQETLLYICYLELLSKEWKENVLGYEKFKEPGKDICIKVNFTWGWLRVYRTKGNSIEWY